ncbi:hypothetical protein ABQF34_07230 [Mycolicibacterium boenickei]
MGYKQRTTVKLLGDRPKSHYVMTPKALLLDGELTSDARLVGIYLLSLSDGWEINQEQIAAALGWPTKSKRVTNAMRNLAEQGWLLHNERKSGKRTFKHEYVLNRSRRVNTVKSTVLEPPQAEPYTVESTPLYTVKSTVSPKEQGTAVEDQTTPAPAWGGAEDRDNPQPEQDPWGDPVPATSTAADPWSTATDRPQLEWPASQLWRHIQAAGRVVDGTDAGLSPSDADLAMTELQRLNLV